MKAPQPKNINKPEVQPDITIAYKSVDNVQTSYVSGLFAAPTPEGMINLVGYVERQGFPERAVLKTTPGGGRTLKDEGGQSFVREIQTSFFIDLSTAESLVEILQEAIDESRARMNRVEARLKKHE